MPPEEFVGQRSWSDGSEEGVQDAEERAVRRRVQHEDTRVRWQRYSKGRRPGQPGIVQQDEVTSVMGDEYAAGAHRGQELSVVGQPREAKIARNADLVADNLERGYQMPGDVMVEVKAGQWMAQASFSVMRASTYFLLRR